MSKRSPHDPTTPPPDFEPDDDEVETGFQALWQTIYRLDDTVKFLKTHVIGAMPGEKLEVKRLFMEVGERANVALADLLNDGWVIRSDLVLVYDTEGSDVPVKMASTLLTRVMRPEVKPIIPELPPLPLPVIDRPGWDTPPPFPSPKAERGKDKDGA